MSCFATSKLPGPDSPLAHRYRQRAPAAAALVGMLMAACAGAAAAADGAPKPLPTFELAGLADWDKASGEFRQIVWNIHSASDRMPKAPDGRTVANYADRWLLPDDANQALATLREAATAAERRGDHAEVSRLVDEAEIVFVLQSLRAASIVAFWRVLTYVEAQTSALQPLLAQAPVPEREATEVRTRPLVAALQRLLDAALMADDPAALMKFAPEFRLESDRVLASYNDERLHLINVLDDGNPPPTPPLSWEREEDCQGAVASRSGRAQPSLDKTSVVQPPYPDDARRAGFEASIVLAVDVSATGCLERVAIAKSSGTRLLDQTALEWARGLRYLPGERDGRAVAGSTRFAVTFRLYDDDLPAPSQPPFDALPGAWDLLGPDFCTRPGLIAFSADKQTMTIGPLHGMPAWNSDGPPIGSYTVLEAGDRELRLKRDGETMLDAAGKPVAWHITLLDTTRLCWRRSDESPGSCTTPPVRRCPGSP